MDSFEWDEAKDKANLRKHEIAFADAIAVFLDPDEVTLPARTVLGELRWRTIGLILDTIFLVVHTRREAIDGRRIIRVISARKASRKERGYYEQQH